MMKSVLCVVVALAGMLPAQELLPELAAPAAQHKAADEALDKQKLEAIALAAKSYVSALNSVETSAATSGKTDVVAAVAKERESLAAGTLEPDLPAGLPPMRLRGSRQALLGKLTQINTDHARRKKQLDGSYINALNALQEKAVSNSELTKQIAAEKAALLAVGGTAASGGGQKAKKTDPNNVVINGDFEKVVDGKPDGWQNAKAVTILTEKGNTFVRFDVKPDKDGSARRFVIEQTDIEIPPKAERCTISARARTAIVALPAQSQSGNTGPVIRLNMFDENGKYQAACQTLRWGGKNGSWKEIEAEGAIPKGAVRATIEPSNGGFSGLIDFDDIEVTFK